MRFVPTLLSVAAAAAPLLASAAEPVDLEVVTRIRDEGLNRSRVMETARVLTDEIGPRLTNSPGMREAVAWTQERLSEWGLANVHAEPFEFGRGWTFSRAEATMIAPDAAILTVWPTAWTPGTEGVVHGKAVRASIESEDDIEKLRGTLAGAIVLLDAPRRLEPPEEPLFTRYSDAELAELETFPVREDGGRPWRRRYRERMELHRTIQAFLKEEGVLAVIEESSRQGGLVRVTGTRAWRDGEDPGLPSLVMAAEHYNRIARLLEHDVPVELEVAVDARFLDDDPDSRNVIAEIPGTDPAAGVVMAGAHLDSWHAGTGATDDAAGCAVVMEALRILEAIGVQPRRTVRAALWSSEEQGYNGSRAYVRQHFARREEPTDPEQRALPEWARTEQTPLVLLPEWKQLAAYFNIDNGGGRIRGIYAQENAAVVPIFEAWLAPFADLGATAVTMRDTSGTDHIPFDRVGLPGFQFVQDSLDYMTRTHHTQMDVFDRLQPADLKQASVVLASFLYHAAMRDEPLPRKPLPPDETEGGEQ